MKFILNKYKNLDTILLSLTLLTLIILISQELNNLGHKKSSLEVSKAIKIIQDKSNEVLTEEDYNNMIEECNCLIQSSYTSSSNVNTDIIIDEIQFVDSYEHEITEDNAIFHHANTIYCDSMVLASFLNNSGEMKSVAAVIDKKAGIIKAVDINKLNTFDKISDYNTNEELDYIGNLIINILKSDKNILEDSTTYEYFTTDSYNEFIEQLDKSNSIDNVEIAFLKAGKSNLDIEYNDRIIIQLITTDESPNIFINVIIKIDKNNKIFDIDIL